MDKIESQVTSPKQDANVRLVVVLGLVALAIYLGFIVLNIII